MNNMNFSKNPFNGVNSNTKIAGNHVFKPSDGGRVSLDDVREKMVDTNRPNIETKKEPTVIPDTQFDATRRRMQSFKNIGNK